jgi:hypothetical protein
MESSATYLAYIPSFIPTLFGYIVSFSFIEIPSNSNLFGCSIFISTAMTYVYSIYIYIYINHRIPYRVYIDKLSPIIIVAADSAES